MDEQNQLNPQPAHQAAPPDAQQTTPEPQAKKKSGLFKFSAPIVGVIVAVIVAGGAGAAMYANQAISNDPEAILRDTLTSAFNAEESKEKIAISYVGEFDVEGDDIPQEFTGVNFEVRQNGDALSADLDVGLTFIKPTLSLLTVDREAFYLKVEGIDSLGPLLGFGTSEGADDVSDIDELIGSVEGQWYELTLQDLEGLGLQAELDQSSGEIEDLNTIMTKISESSVVKFVERGEEDSDTVEIAGQESVRYRVSVDKAGVETLIQEIKSSNLSILQDGSDEDWAQLEDFVSSANLESFPFDIWINEDEKLVNRILIDNTYDTGNNVTVDVKVSQRGGDIAITAPADARSFQDLFTDVLGGLGPLIELPQQDVFNLPEPTIQ